MSKETFYIPPNLAFPDWNMFVYGMFTCIFILRAYASHTLKKTHTTPPPTLSCDRTVKPMQCIMITGVGNFFLTLPCIPWFFLFSSGLFKSNVFSVFPQISAVLWYWWLPSIHKEERKKKYI